MDTRLEFARIFDNIDNFSATRMEKLILRGKNEKI